jgi:peptidyl-prolyl cis-trans isomerase D
MTMLDQMRRHKGWLKWSLGLVVVAFIWLYIPAFVDAPSAGVGPTGIVAEIEGRQITAADFRRVYLQQLDQLRASSGGDITLDLLRQLGIDRQILLQMINEQAALAEASRLGLSVTDAEVRERLLTLPALQDLNGQFIGEAGYRQLLRVQNPPITPDEFEEGLRQSLLTERLQTVLTDWITISDAELEEEYRRRNEKVKLGVVTFWADDYRDEVEASDEDIATLYAQNMGDYEVPEKRRIRFLVVDVDSIAEALVIPPDEIENSYNANIDRYSTPGRVRASHILLGLGDKDEDTVRQQGEAILAQAKAGADFAELARQYSEDEATAELGGDLDFFGRGQMVPEFEAAAFEMEPGAVSDLVQTAIGFHIIKVVEKVEEVIRPLDEVTELITNQLKFDRSQARGTALAQSIAAEVTRPPDLDRAAAGRGLTVQESGFAAVNEPILGLGPVPALMSVAFQLAEGEVEGPISIPQGYAFITVTGIQEPYIPPLEDVRDEVQDDVIQRKAQLAAQDKAAETAASLRDADDFAGAAEAAELVVETTELITRGSRVAGLGVSPELDAVAFSLASGETSDPVQVGSTMAIVHVMERQEVTDVELAAARETFRDELLSQRRNRFFGAYMSRAMERMTIEEFPETLLQVTT